MIDYKDLTPEQKDRLAQFAEGLFTMEAEVKRLEGLTNEQLARELIENVWGSVDLFSRQDAILEVVIERLRNTSHG